MLSIEGILDGPSLVINASWFPPLAACRGAAVGKVADVAPPVMYALFAASTAMPAALSLPLPPKYVLQIKLPPGLSLVTKAFCCPRMLF